MRDDRGDEGESLDTACSARRFIQRNERHQNCGKCGEYVGQIPMPLGGRVRWIDPCIAPIVAALNAAGIRTEASCCGHGTRPGIILLEDGRELRIFERQPDAAPAHAPADEWYWNAVIPPPVELPSADLRWRYDPHTASWNVMSGKQFATSLGHVRSSSSECRYWAFVRAAIDGFGFTNSIEACRKLARLVEEAFY